LHPVLLASTNDGIKKNKNNIKKYFFIKLSYTKFL